MTFVQEMNQFTDGDKSTLIKKTRGCKEKLTQQDMFNNAMLLYELMETNQLYTLKQLCVIWGKDRTRIYMNLLVSYLKVEKIPYKLENNNTKAFKFVKIIEVDK